MAPPALKDRITVGVDFGTTFSRVAAAYGLQPRLQTTFKRSKEEERLRCLKLALDNGQVMPSYVHTSDLDGQLKRNGKTPETATADYLMELWKHARGPLEDRFTKSIINNTEIEFIFTVPAEWSDAAKDATRRAAQRAGMGVNLTLISEPEAAALYTLKTKQPKLLRPGFNYILCDAGGGTIDLISYEVKQVKPLRIEESARGM